MKKIDKRLLTKKLTLTGLFLALALIVSVIESMLPPIIPALPYAKIGFGNIILLMSFLIIGIWEGYIILILRCVFTAIFAGNFSMLLWSLPAGIVAYSIMIALSKTRVFSITGISIAGAMIHNLVQMLIGAIIVGTSILAYLPYMILAGGLAGFVTGLIAYFTMKIIDKINLSKAQKYALEVQENIDENDDIIIDD